MTAQEAREQLGDSVSLYLDGGRAPGGVSSTIVDATGPRPRVVRQGALTLEALRAVVPGVLGLDEPADADGAAGGVGAPGA
jgi:tRNA A37 threonylcarbamoyladenosine synthetase subunit TsaC/SUA5/YrdC